MPDPEQAGHAGLLYAVVEVCGHTLDVALLQDIIGLAKIDRSSLLEALDLYTWQEEFAIAANKVREAHPDDYAGAEFVPHGTSWIAFKGAVPNSAFKPFIDMPEQSEPVKFVGGRGFSELEIKEILEEEFHRVSRQVGVKGAAGKYDPISGHISIEVWPTSPAASKGLATARSALRRPDIPVTVTLAAGPLGEPQREIYGGSRMLHNYPCTSAFTVRRTTNSTFRGVLTAHHCAINDAGGTLTTVQHFWPTGSPGSTNLTFWGYVYDRDAAWYANFNTGHTVGYNFYNSNTGWRPTTGWRFPVVGETLQRYGRVTGQASGKVHANNWCHTYAGYPQFCGFTAVDPHGAQNGDSGGPWYVGNTAMGIHSGGHWSWGKTYGIFTPVGEVLGDLDVYLVTL